MNISKTNIFRLLILIAAVLYGLVVFLIAFFGGAECTESFWVVFSFTLAVFVVAFIATFFKGDGRRHFALTAYFIRIPVIFFVVQLLLHLLLLIPSLSFVVVLIIEIFLTLGFVAFTLYRLLHTKVITDNLQKQREQVRYLAKLEAHLTTVAAACEDEDVKKLINDFTDKVRYSDYNSCDEVSDIEKQMVALAASLTGQEPDEQIKTLKKLNTLLTQRNSMILMLK